MFDDREEKRVEGIEKRLDSLQIQLTNLYSVVTFMQNNGQQLPISIPQPNDNNDELEKLKKELEEAKANLATKYNIIEGLNVKLSEANEKYNQLEDTAKANSASKDSIIADLNAKLSDANEKNNRLEDAAKANLANKDRIIAELNGKLSEANEKLGDLRTKLSEYDCYNLFPLYEKLSDKIKGNLENVFPLGINKSMGIMASGLQKGNIIALYKFVRKRIADDKSENVEELKTLVSQLISIYNEGAKQPFELIVPEIDSEYKQSEHTSTNNKHRGSIAEVLLFGIKGDGEFESALVVVQ